MVVVDIVAIGAVRSMETAEMMGFVVDVGVEKFIEDIKSMDSVESVRIVDSLRVEV